MIDCTSSLYLGMTHPSSALGGWPVLTTGKPACLARAPSTDAVERELAALQGCERATLAPSTLHLVWDLFGAIAGEGTVVHVDDGTYAVLRWGAERAQLRGATVRTFRHHDVRDLVRQVQAGSARGRVVVATDGFCPSCGDFAPLASYAAVARANGGLVVVDDTQALGVYGAPAHGAPYGTGGGGSLAHLRVEAKDILVLASLAKGFGAPIAALSGEHEPSRLFRSRSGTRVHSSPPSSVALRAAGHALFDNAARGDTLRFRLLDNVRRFAARLRAGGVAVRSGLFPVVRLREPRGLDLSSLCSALARRGVRSFIQARCAGGAQLALVLRADQEPEQIDRAAAALLSAVGASRHQFDLSQAKYREETVSCGPQRTDMN